MLKHKLYQFIFDNKQAKHIHFRSYKLTQFTFLSLQ
jgi:hypothetical protein